MCCIRCVLVNMQLWNGKWVKKMLAEYHFQDQKKRKKKKREKPHQCITSVTPLFYQKNVIEKNEKKPHRRISFIRPPYTRKPTLTLLGLIWSSFIWMKKTFFMYVWHQCVLRWKLFSFHDTHIDKQWNNMFWKLEWLHSRMVDTIWKSTHIGLQWCSHWMWHRRKRGKSFW